MLTDREIYLVKVSAKNAAKEVVSSLLSNKVLVTSKEAMRLLGCGKNKLASLRDKGVITFEKDPGKTAPVLYHLNSILEYKASRVNGLSQYTLK